MTPTGAKEVLLVALAAAAVAAGAEEPVALRAEPFTVPPSTGPVTHVRVRNLLGKGYEGAVRLGLPEGWKAEPSERNVNIEPGQTARVPFTVQGGKNLKANRYPVTVRAVGGGATVVRKQEIVCASAPYYKPRIDGRLGEWHDAIPVTFATKGKKTVVYTYWNPRQFCLAVEVEEDDLEGRSGEEPCDAVQFAIAPRTAETGRKAVEKAGRYEFLLTAGTGWFGRDRCFALIEPGKPLAAARRQRDLDDLIVKTARLSIRRRRGVTRYECAIPAKVIRDIRLTVGREIRFSLLVHDPDGTGLRDLGQAMGLWPSQRNRLAWCTWAGARWGEQPPLDSKIEWGLCSSRR
ncbi:MAG: NEW3 domain-containing protein [Planctomycetota bacterium]